MEKVHDEELHNLYASSIENDEAKEYEMCGECSTQDENTKAYKTFI
jgi:hypothetical protein